MSSASCDSHGHAAAPAAAAAHGEPTPFLSDPAASSTARCRRRFNDLTLLRLDAIAPHSYAGKDARFAGNKADLYGLVRERYLLWAKCVESAPGKEPQHPYLYPQPAAAAPAHH